MPKSPRRKAPHPPVVIVEWHDSATVDVAWTAPSVVSRDAEDAYSKTMMSAGFLLEVRKRYIVLVIGAASYNDDVLHALLIPRSEIVSLKTLKKARGMKPVKVRQVRT